MAIPIVFPNSEEAEDSYRSLDLLLEQLLITLRQVLMHRRREAAANAYLQTVRHRLVQSDITPIEETSERLEESRRGYQEETACAHPNLPLPDVVLQSTQDSQQEQKESERTNTINAEERSEAIPTATPTPPPTTTTSTTTTGQAHSWVQVGGDLKRLDEPIAATNRLDQKEEKKGKIKDDKETSLLSLICPPLGSSVLTTVALLVGWGLFSRTR